MCLDGRELDVLKVSTLGQEIDTRLRMNQLPLYKQDKLLREREGIEGPV